MSNRIIKFRVWDIEFEEFCYKDQLKWNNTELNKIFKSKSFIFQQFTGLKDKSNKDIYEGDIVYKEKSEYYPGMSFEVQYIEREARFATVNKKRDIAWDLGCDKFNKKIKVIGNIFEHPQLLNS